MKVHHIGFLAKNGKATVEEYKTIGAVVEQEERVDNIRRIKITFIILDGYRIEIIEPIDKESPYYPLMKRFKNSPYHTCYEVSDLDESLEKLQAEGYVVTSMPEAAPCLDGRRVAFLMSRSMGLIELLETK